MPLIRALRGWMGRRLNDSTYPGGPPDHASVSRDTTGAVWLALLIIALPLIGLLVLIGLAYEAVIRIDRRGCLTPPLAWGISSVVGLALVTAVSIGALNRL